MSPALSARSRSASPDSVIAEGAIELGEDFDPLPDDGHDVQVSQDDAQRFVNDPCQDEDEDSDYETTLNYMVKNLTLTEAGQIRSFLHFRPLCFRNLLTCPFHHRCFY